MKVKNVFTAFAIIFGIVAMAAGVAYFVYRFLNRMDDFCEEDYLDYGDDYETIPSQTAEPAAE